VTAERTVITVEIAGEEYTIRSEATQEHMRECARVVNEAISEIMARGSLVEAHKAAILAALALADQLIQCRRDARVLTDEVAVRSRRLVAEIEAKLAAGGLASTDR
jgi:cell division protein ZapA